MTSKIDNVYKKLICPKCGSLLSKVTDVEIDCPGCSSKFPIVSSIPVVIDENKSIFRISDFTDKKNLFFDLSSKGKFKSIVSKIIPSNVNNWKANKRLKSFGLLLEKFNPNARVLIIGGSIEGDGVKELLSFKNFIFIESDVSFGPKTAIVLDCHNIPYSDNSFDAIIVQAVLEHVINPVKCVEEIYRCLKNGGLVYAETPFMQQVHGGPYDFTRFTASGHRLLFQKFSEIESGVVAGAGTAFLWSYEYLLLALFGVNNAMELVIKVFARTTGFWLKYLDLISISKKNNKNGASGFYFIGKKQVYLFTNKDIIEYYHLTR